MDFLFKNIKNKKVDQFTPNCACVIQQSMCCHGWPHKQCGFFVLTPLNWTSILDWHMAWLVLRNWHQKYMLFIEIGLCAENILSILISSTSNTIWEGHLRRKIKVSIFDLLYLLHLASYYETWDDNIRDLRLLTRYDNSQFDPTCNIVLEFGSAHNGGMWYYISYAFVHQVRPLIFFGTSPLIMVP